MVILTSRRIIINNPFNYLSLQDINIIIIFYYLIIPKPKYYNPFPYLIIPKYKYYNP